VREEAKTELFGSRHQRSSKKERRKKKKDGAVAVHAQPLIAGFSQNSLNAFLDIAGARLAVFN
jgi:hypothetical protein